MVSPDEFDRAITIHERVTAAIDAGFEMPVPDGTQVGPMTGIAMAQHEMVLCFEEQGFSRAESLYMVSAVFSGNPGHAPGF